MPASNPAPKIRFQSNTQGLRVHTRGQHVGFFEDIYHKVLAMPWRRFFLYVAITWLGMNAIFACLFALVPGSVTNASPGFEDAFYFSVQTFATIGYGTMAPGSRYGHLVVVVEAFVGTLGVALATGVTFAKFARPTARVLFADKAVIQLRDGEPHLVFRLANWRGNMVVEGQLRVLLLMRQVTREGDVIRMPVELPLVRDRTALFTLSWMPMHRIDAKSPFWGGTDAIEKLRAQGAEIFLSFNGIDETLGSQIHARCRYKLDAVAYNARFVDVLTLEDSGDRTIDYSRFHMIERLGPHDPHAWWRGESDDERADAAGDEPADERSNAAADA